MRPLAAGAAPLDAIRADVERYYSAKVAAHGPTPLGADWSCEPTQQLRLLQLLKSCDLTRACTLNDFGCGYGALLALLAQRHPHAAIDYLGTDLSAAMVSHARRLWHGRPQTAFEQGAAPSRVADYTLASGVFNVKLAHSEAQWRAYVASTLDTLFAASRRAVAVNFLAPVRQPSVAQLYRPAPDEWRAYCEREFGASVTVVADYGMREYTLLARLA